MIEFLRIKNFQRHAALRLTFTPGINSIVGRTDAGKSSAIRALRWIAQNRPAGDENTTHEATECRAQLAVDGRKATRTRTATENSYTLEVDGKSKTYKAIGQSVPDDVTKALALADVNFQFQMDGPFWFSLSAGERCRAFNEIVDLSAIDVALSRLATLSKKRQTALEIAQERHGAARMAADALNHVPAMEARLDALETLEGAAEESEELLDAFDALLTKAAAAGNARNAAAKRLEALERLEACAALSSQAVAHSLTFQYELGQLEEAEEDASNPPPVEQFAELQRLHVEWREADQAAYAFADLHGTLARIKIPRVPEADAAEKLQTLKAAHLTAEAELGMFTTMAAATQRAAADVRTAAEAVKVAERELKSIPVCPTCGKPTGEP